MEPLPSHGPVSVWSARPIRAIRPSQGDAVRLEELTPGARVSGILPEDVRIIAVHPVGDSAVEVTFKDADGQVGQQLLYRTDQAKLDLATASGPTFDGDGAAFRLAAEALRIRMAGQHDAMLAVTTSDLEPLPHQIRAVYGELLPRVPLRFLLADDPGAGKTIMVGSTSRNWLSAATWRDA
jgi:hypothetical protein